MKVEWSWLASAVLVSGVSFWRCPSQICKWKALDWKVDIWVEEIKSKNGTLTGRNLVNCEETLESTDCGTPYMLEATADLVDDAVDVDTRVLKVLFGYFPTLLKIKVALCCPSKLLHLSNNCCLHPSCRNILDSITLGTYRFWQKPAVVITPAKIQTLANQRHH